MDHDLHLAEHDAVINPECRSKKHRNCDFRALCQACDAIVGCECACHEDGDDDSGSWRLR